MEKSNPRWIDIKVAKQILLGTIATIASSSLELGGGCEYIEGQWNLSPGTEGHQWVGKS